MNHESAHNDSDDSYVNLPPSLYIYKYCGIRYIYIYTVSMLPWLLSSAYCPLSVACHLLQIAIGGGSRCHEHTNNIGIDNISLRELV